MISMTQTQKIREHLNAGLTITQYEALLHYGCLRLGARIWDLKQQGVSIIKEMVSENGKTFARYRLAK